jgi:pilus assembly protein CpaF
MGMDMPLAAIRQQIASGIDIIVHLGRLRDKSRKVLEITEIAGYEDGAIRLNTLYRFEEEGQDENEKIIGTLKEQNTLIHKDKLKAAGL